jgi:hypothetical protein
MRIFITESQYKRLFEDTVDGGAPNYDNGCLDFVPKSQVGITGPTTDSSGKGNKLKTHMDTDKITKEMPQNNVWSTRR